MVSIAERFVNGAASAASAAPSWAVIGALGGYIYAKFADLPAREAAIAWAVFHAAQGALSAFVETLVEGEAAKVFLSTTIDVATTFIGITELQKRGLIGHKMSVFLAVMQVLSATVMLGSLAIALATSDQN